MILFHQFVYSNIILTKINLINKPSLILSFFFYISIGITNPYYSQDLDYGLNFIGQSFKLDDRTHLNLNSQSTFNFKSEFELVFDVRFNHKNNQERLFGYIVRIINDDNNIDLLISNNKGRKNFVVVDSNKQTTLEPALDNFDINKWHNIKLKVSIENELLIITIGDRLVKKKTQLKNLKNLQFLFGANDIKGYTTRDVPNMTLKNVKIYEGNKLKYNFPLSQCGGKTTLDKENGVVANIINENWELCKHSQWEKEYAAISTGVQLQTVNELTGEIYLLSNKSITKFNKGNGDIIKYDFDNKNYKLTLDHRIFFNTNDNKLYCYLIDSQQLSAFNFNTQEWDNESIFFENKIASLYQHHTGMFNPINNTFYIFGGYGQFEYKNNLFSIELKSRKWTKIDSINNKIKPRYFAAGHINEDYIYLLGGYGSETGNQQINPKSYFDLIKYDLKTKTSNTVVNIDPFFDDMIFSNNIIIDKMNNDFFALVSEKSKFSGNLKLIKVNLNDSEVILLKDSIPFKFQDTRTYFDLYRDKKNNTLKAFVSYFNDKEETEFSIYTINYPPIALSDATISNDFLKINTIFLISGILALFTIVLIIRYKLKKKPQPKISVKETFKHSNDVNKPIRGSNFQILFFGGFQVFNTSNNEVTGDFSPLLKELFLLIFLHSQNDDKGVSSEKLQQILWYDMSEKKAQNNRAVNFTKLKKILEEVGDLVISKETGYWRILNNDKKEINDYLFVKNKILRKKPNKEDIRQLINIVKRGAFLGNEDYEWLDKFRETITDSIIDYITNYVKKFHNEDDANFLIEISQCLFNFDSINELSLYIKCKAYNKKGNHKLVEETYKKFYGEYKLLYGEDFNIPLNDILTKDLDLFLY